MDTLDEDVTRSLRGSAIRDRLLRAAAERGHAYLEQLAHDAGVAPRRAREALVGAPPRFATELSLVGLRLVRRAHGTRFEITPRGREVVRVRLARGTRFL